MGTERVTLALSGGRPDGEVALRCVVNKTLVTDAALKLRDEK